MFKIDNVTNTISLTRGDEVPIGIIAEHDDGTPYIFQKNDVIRFACYIKGNYNEMMFKKDVTIEEETTVAVITLTTDETRIGEIINKPVEYWYEVQLNPDTSPQTIIGYDDSGAKIFRLYPEGVDVNE